MDPDFLNNLYLVGTLLATMSVIVWRFTSVSQKAIQHSVDSLQPQIKSLQRQIDSQQLQIKEQADRMESSFTKLEDRLEKMDDRVRELQMDMVVVKDRLNILTDDRPASPVPVRAGAPAPKAVAAEA